MHYKPFSHLKNTVGPINTLALVFAVLFILTACATTTPPPAPEFPLDLSSRGNAQSGGERQTPLLLRRAGLQRGREHPASAGGTGARDGRALA